MIVLLARLVLAGVFVVSGMAKLADRQGVRRAVVEFGVPAGIAAPLGGLLVVSEFAAALLLVGPWPWVGGLAAAALLLGFSGAIALNLARGRKPDCHCFGRLSAGPVGWSTLARNGALLALAALVALDGRFSWLLAGLGVLALGLWRGPALRRWLRRTAGAAAFALPDETGQTWTLAALLGLGRPLALVFSQPTCGACDLLLPALARWQRDLEGQVTIVLVSSGSRAAALDKARQHGLRRALADERQELFRAYGVTATPSAALIAGNGKRAGALAQGAAEIERLIGQALERQAPGFTRRRLLRRVAGGAASVAALPAFAALASACDPARGSSLADSATPTVVSKNEVHVDGAWLCNQPYALCTTAPCEVSRTDPNIAVCHCVVQNGYSIGSKTCAQRAQVGETLISTFSTENVTSSFHIMSCPSGAAWANCLDMTCQVDATNPAMATCQCRLMKTGESFTFGGGCQTSTCHSVIWSGATQQFSANAQYIAGMKAVNQPYTFPQGCPGSKGE
jgi:peroxiredoxin